MSEPQVHTEDVKRILHRHGVRGDGDDGESVDVIADKARTSTRTVYRVLQVKTVTIRLDLADRLVMAAGGHLSECRLVWKDRKREPQQQARRDLAA